MLVVSSHMLLECPDGNDRHVRLQPELLAQRLRWRIGQMPPETRVALPLPNGELCPSIVE